MALTAKSNGTDECSDDEDSKMKSYITRQFKKFMKNANRRKDAKEEIGRASCRERVFALV